MILICFKPSSKWLARVPSAIVPRLTRTRAARCAPAVARCWRSPPLWRMCSSRNGAGATKLWVRNFVKKIRFSNKLSPKNCKNPIKNFQVNLWAGTGPNQPPSAASLASRVANPEKQLFRKDENAFRRSVFQKKNIFLKLFPAVFFLGWYSEVPGFWFKIPENPEPQKKPKVRA